MNRVRVGRQQLSVDRALCRSQLGRHTERLESLASRPTQARIPASLAGASANGGKREWNAPVIM